MTQDNDILSTILKGSCLCGEIQYQVSSLASTRMAHCHCTDCRKFHGAAFSTFGDTKTLEWTKGESFLVEYIASNGSRRRFCRQCGSSLTFQSRNADPDSIEFSLATLDEGSASLKPDAHVFVDSKVPWIRTDLDGLRQYQRGRL